MSVVATVKENIQGQDTTLKVFEEILKEKLDLIFKQTPAYHLPPLPMEEVNAGCFQSRR